MKYTIQSGKYVAKNFYYIFPFAILPAFFFSLSTDEKAIFTVVEKLLSARIGVWSFKNLFRAISFLNFASLKSIAFGFIGVVAMVLCGALMMALLEKHMRIGKRTFNGVFSKLNDNLTSTIMYVLVLLALYEVWALIATTGIFLLARIPIKILAYILTCAFFVVMNALLLWTVSFFYLWLPCMQITGFRSLEALVYVNRIASAGSKLRILISQLVVLLFAELTICLCAYLLVADFVAFTIVTTVLFSIMIMIYCVRMEVAYFDVDHLERADIKKYY